LLPAKLLELLGKSQTAPVCLFDIPRKGGATYYSMRRMEEYLAEGLGVLRLTCGADGALAGTVHYRDLSASLALLGLPELFAANLPRFQTLLVNNLAGWTLPVSYQKKAPPVGEGRPRWIPALTGLICRLAEHWNARLEFVVHDFLPVCPNFILLNDEEQLYYCGVPDLAGCETCLKQPFMRSSVGPTFTIATWRTAWDAFLSRADAVTCPSLSSRDILLRAFSPAGKTIEVIPHAPLSPSLTPLALPDREIPMHIAVVGQITAPKGAKIVRDLALLLQERNPQARLTLVGTLAAPGIQLPDTVLVTGPYDKEHLAGVLHNLGVTIGLIASVWPETFHYVTQELMSLELPLVCFDLGAPAERIRSWEHGIVAKKVSAQAALAALEMLDARRNSR
jgi:glycosyltransferase involved in cell wall biosynthesis